MKAQLRKRWLTVHSWVGLVAGLMFVLMGLTGSALVFDHAIDEWLNPQLLLTEGSGEKKPLSELLHSLDDKYGAQPVSVSSPRIDGGVWTAWYSKGTKDEPRWMQVHIDPYTAEITGERIWGEYFMSWIYLLHYTLLGGKTGQTIVGISGLILMLSVASGIYLWWPLWKNGWRAAWTIRRGERFNYDLHKTVGIVSSLVLLVVAFTGVYMTFPDWVKPIVTAFSTETKFPEDVQSTSTDDGVPITADQAAAIAMELFPEATFCHFHPPQDGNGAYEVAVRQSGEGHTSFGGTQVWLDQRTGEVVAMRNSRDRTAADTFIAWQFPLHNGEAFGLIGRWIVFLSGLAPSVLYVTGCMLWWRKRASRKRQQARKHVMTTRPRELAEV